MSEDGSFPGTADEAQLTALKELRNQLEELETIYRSAHVGLCVLDRELRFVRVNERLAEIHGTPAEDHIGRTMGEVISSLACAAEEIGRRVLDTGLPELNVEFHGSTPREPQKEHFWIEHWVPITNKAGAVTGINVAVHEVTEQKQAEALLRQSRDKIEAIHNGMLDGLLIADVETRRFVRVNPRMCQMLGYPEDELLSLRVEDIHPPAVMEKMIEQFQAAKRGELEIASDLPLLRKDGMVIYADVGVKPLIYEGRPCLIGLFHDITKRKLAEEELRQSQNDMHRAQHVGQIGSWRLDVRENILKWSDETHRIFGVPKGTRLTYEKFMELVHPDDRRYVDAQWKEGMQGNPYDIEHRILVGDQVKWIREKAYVEFDDSGKILSGFGIAQDITDRKMMEEQLTRSRDELEERVKVRTRELSKLVQTLHEQSDQLRRMTRELTLVEQHERQRLAQLLHDGLQQLLVAAKFSLGPAAREPNLNEPLGRVRDIIDEAIDTSRSLAAELSPPVLLRGDLSSALEWLADWMHRRHELVVRLQLPAKTIPLTKDVILLLFKTARELLFNVVKHAEVREAGLYVRMRKNRITMTVEDEGIGFNPGQYEGFGLSSIRERLSLMGGDMEIDSAPGRGSRFRIITPILPRTTATSPSRSLKEMPVRDV